LEITNNLGPLYSRAIMERHNIIFMDILANEFYERNKI
jgi:hypothetical protein